MNDFNLFSTSYSKVKGHKYDLAILPWGATEPHNLHLPYLTDCICAHRVAVDALAWAMKNASIRGMVLPYIPLGSQNQGQRDKLFCIHARYETQKAVLTDVVASLSGQGISKLVIVNGHGGNSFKNMLRDLLVDYPDFLIAVVDWFAVVPQTGYFNEKDDHAGEMETSVVLYYHPELVSFDEAGDGAFNRFAIDAFNNGTAWTPRNWDRISRGDTGVGNPKSASAEKGERFVKAVVEKIGQLFIDFSTKELYYL